MKFIFDLDGTITSKETLPAIADYFGIYEEISKLTEQTVKGDIPFIESFIKRVDILNHIPVSDIDNFLSGIPLFSNLLEFIHKNKDDCIIATGNFGGWVEKLVKRIGCQCFGSEGIVENDKIIKLTKILKKETVVNNFKDQDEFVVFIGDGNNDVAAMNYADIAIACGLVHKPAKSVNGVADYAVFSEAALCRLLNQIYTNQKGKSLIISCAGTGTRLGLGQTKALIKIKNKPLIYYQLEYFYHIEDVRVVVGFQAEELITTVLKKRDDVIFAYNHDYFHTKTGASYYLGARHGNEYAIAWDGDLLIHPDDIKKCLEYEGEFIGCSDAMSDEPVFVDVDENNYAVGFSRKSGDYEWVGPACLKKQKIKYTVDNVFNQFEEYLPLPILKTQARDIDTYEDYRRAKEFIGHWPTNNKEIIGIIGGAGVAATNKFNEILENKITMNGAFRDFHHPVTISYQVTNAPSRSMFLEGKGPSFVPDYIEAGLKLKNAGAVIICMVCNTAHHYFDEIQKAINLPFINMIEETVKAVKNENKLKVGIIASNGTVKEKIYDKYFEYIFPEAKIIYPDNNVQEDVTRAIVNTKNKNRFSEENNTERPKFIFQSVGRHLQGKGANIIISACTDIRVDFSPQDFQDIKIIDSLEVLSDVAIKRLQERINNNEK